MKHVAVDDLTKIFAMVRGTTLRPIQFCRTVPVIMKYVWFFRQMDLRPELQVQMSAIKLKDLVPNLRVRLIHTLRLSVKYLAVVGRLIFLRDRE